MNEENTQDGGKVEATENEEVLDQIDSYEEAESQEDSKEEVESQGESEQSEKSEESEEPELTEKGTKLDPDPQSAVHQQLANERRARLEAEQKVVAYNNFLQRQKQQAETPQSLIDPTKLKTREDVATAINQVYALATTYKSEIDSLKTQLGQSSQVMRDSQNYSSLEKEVSSVKEQYPELNDKSGSYNEGLDKQVTKLYARLAYDSDGRLLPNRISLEEFAQPIVEAVRLATGVGSKQAQTRVVQKSLGKVQTNKKKGSETIQNLSPEAALEVEMEKMGF